MRKALETMLSRLDEPHRSRFLDLWEESGAFFQEAARIRKAAFSLYREHRTDRATRRSDTAAVADTSEEAC